MKGQVGDRTQPPGAGLGLPSQMGAGRASLCLSCTCSRQRHSVLPGHIGSMVGWLPRPAPCPRHCRRGRQWGSQTSARPGSQPRPVKGDSEAGTDSWATGGPQPAYWGVQGEGWPLSVVPARGLQKTRPPFLPEAGAQVTCAGSQRSPASGVDLSKQECPLTGRRGASTWPRVLGPRCLQGHLIILTSARCHRFFSLNPLLKSRSVSSARRFKGPEGRSHHSQVEVPGGFPSCALQRFHVRSWRPHFPKPASRPWVTPVEFRTAREEPGPASDFPTWRLAPTGLSQTHSRELCTELDAQSSLLLINA